MMRKLLCVVAGVLILLTGCVSQEETKKELPLLKVSENGRYFQDENGHPFFWLGDTDWLIFTKLTREEVDLFMDNRVEKGFNVLQVSILHGLGDVNIYGDSALIHKNVAKPLITDGSNPNDSVQYDYWDHADYIIDLAGEKGLYVAIVPVWGNNVKYGGVTLEEATIYSRWLAQRYADRNHIVWLNGGDTFGNDSTEIWKSMGRELKANAPDHLVTFHPRGRCSSTDWFHNESWLDFNMIQSGHRRYDQDDTERAYGQDNWRYIADDYLMEPAKPTIDGEPSYEGIPQGLHDVNEVFWNDNDVRRYGYWSVFAGAFGYTYGHNAIMQFYTRNDKEPGFGAKDYWDVAMNDAGAGQMVHLKELMLSRSFFNRIPNQKLLAENGEKYDYKVATSGDDYAFIYTYRGGIIKVNMSELNASNVKVSWFNPRNGEITDMDVVEATGIQEFVAPGEVVDGNDWVLIFDKV